MPRIIQFDPFSGTEGKPKNSTMAVMQQGLLGEGAEESLAIVDSEMYEPERHDPDFDIRGWLD